ncbi:MAG: hypothetical protein KGN79_05205 [Acidobacteriota bacterium]|nr:hypothetical protein [Acidobacteriota bacterium]
MLPSELKLEQFSAYPPQAHALVARNLLVLRVLPLSLAPNLLREVIDYDYKFPAEQMRIDEEFKTLAGLSPSDREEWLRGFASISLSKRIEQFDWVNDPVKFSEQQSAYLWSTHQMDAFRNAANEYYSRLSHAIPKKPLALQRLGISVIGMGVDAYDEPLFQNLKSHGTLFNQLKPDNGLELLLSAVEARAQASPSEYEHWYIDGGTLIRQPQGITCMSYASITPMRSEMLRFMQKEIQTPGMGPEQLRSDMAAMTPQKLGAASSGNQVLDRFQLKVLSEGSGTQIFSTTFVQWTTREVLRRAEPLTLFERYAPRQRQRPMNELLTESGKEEELDPKGSLMDADMGSYYHFINQQRLEGFDKSVFLVWWEGHKSALVVSPTLPRGTTSGSVIDLGELLKVALG